MVTVVGTASVGSVGASGGVPGGNAPGGTWLVDTFSRPNRATVVTWPLGVTRRRSLFAASVTRASPFLSAARPYGLDSVGFGGSSWSYGSGSVFWYAAMSTTLLILPCRSRRYSQVSPTPPSSADPAPSAQPLPSRAAATSPKRRESVSAMVLPLCRPWRRYSRSGPPVVLNAPCATTGAPVGAMVTPLGEERLLRRTFSLPVPLRAE